MRLIKHSKIFKKRPWGIENNLPNGVRNVRIAAIFTLRTLRHLVVKRGHQTNDQGIRITTVSQ